MAIVEGCRRLRFAGRSIGLTGFSMLAVGFLTTGVICQIQYKPAAMLVQALDSLVFYMGGIAFVFGGLIWLGGWILEGFASPDRQSD